MKKNYDASAWERAEAYIYDIPKFTKKNTLWNTQKLLELMGSPGVGRKIIHVAGTNGKGSVCNYLNSLFLGEGTHVGMFTSPHLVTMNERIRIDGKIISKDKFLNAYDNLRSFLEKILQDEKKRNQECQGQEMLQHPTFFEFLFLLAMQIFEEADVDVIILETGLGGRLDSTNVISKPWLTVITQIGLDHMMYLGETKEKIAQEKAGIIKTGVPVVFADSLDETTQVIVEKAKEMGCNCYPVTARDAMLQKISNKNIDFSYKSSYYDYVTFTLSTLALYQTENAALALKAYEVLRGRETDLLQMKASMKNANWEGRMEEVLPDVYVDGAHNADGIHAFLETVAHMPKDRKSTLVFSVVDDKAYETMIDTVITSNLFQRFVVVEMPQERCVPLNRLKEIFGKYHEIDVFFSKDIEDGLKESVYKRDEDERVFIAGSLYLVGFIKTVLGGKIDD